VNPASLAELLMMRIRLVYVISNCVGTREEFELFGLGSDVPESIFPASRAVASPGFGGEIKINLEFDSAAEATSVESFNWHCFSVFGLLAVFAFWVRRGLFYVRLVRAEITLPLNFRAQIRRTSAISHHPAMATAVQQWYEIAVTAQETGRRDD
jgi:hypothetical protein